MTKEHGADQGKKNEGRVRVFDLDSLSIQTSNPRPQISAARPLGGEQWLEKILGNIQSLARGPIPPSRGSPCTHIPDNGSGKCRLGARNFAGHIVAHAPPAFPAGAIINSDAASVTI
ncbi:unnamed protein product [Dovyalis caffra]|uniref:Uncharacterized protein n=1 Tax=Dovyalis caffra TaxID=77055 RepID=A0AAV1RWA3_9ROSI|nr:unnamed protein product [Dovyalis caffra]